MAASIVRLICPNLKCRAVLSVPVSARGKTVRCRQCGMRVSVPATAGATANAAAKMNSAPAASQD